MASLNTTVTVSRLPIPVSPSAGLVLATLGAVKSPVVKFQPTSFASATPFTSVTPVVMVTLYCTCSAKADLGAKVTVFPVQLGALSVTGLLALSVTIKVFAVTVA